MAASVPNPAPVPPATSTHRPSRVLLGLTGALILAIVVAPIAAFLLAFFSQPPTASKLATVILTAHPPTSKLTIWLAPPVARWELERPLALQSYFANDSDNPILVALTLAAGNTCRPQMRMIRPIPQAGREEILLVPPHDHTEAVVEVGAERCEESVRDAGIPLQLHYAWQETVTPALPAPAAASVNQKPPHIAQPRPVAFDAVASTSPIVFATANQLRWARWNSSFHAAYTMIKDLVWPLLLAFLGFIFQQILARQSDERERLKKIQEDAETKRAEQQEQEQSKRSREQQEAETRRAQRQQVLTHLLPEYMSLVQKHYLPIARRIQTVESEWDRFSEEKKAATKVAQAAASSPSESSMPAAKKPEDDSFTRLLTAILLMRRRLLHLFTKKGGIFFRTSTGEEIFANCISEFTEKCQKLFGKDAFESAALSLEPDTTHPNAIRMLFDSREVKPASNGEQSPAIAPLPDMNTMLAAFTTWARNDTEMELDLNLLRLCDRVVSFECDRIFYQTDPDQKLKPGQSVNDSSGWYFDAPQLAISGAMLELPAPIATENAGKNLDGVYSKERTYWLLAEYQKRVPEECWPKGVIIPTS